MTVPIEELYGWSHDYYLGKWVVRVWNRWYPSRNMRRFSIGYCTHKWGVYLFGFGPIGFMVWPPRGGITQ